MTFLYGFIAGTLFWWAVHRILMAFGFEIVRQMKRDRFQREILGKANYDSLIVYQQQVDAELKKRRGE